MVYDTYHRLETNTNPRSRRIILFYRITKRGREKLKIIKSHYIKICIDNIKNIHKQYIWTMYRITLICICQQSNRLVKLYLFALLYNDCRM